MNTSVSASVEAQSEAPATLSALQALEKDHRWLQAGPAERAVLERIAAQRDRLKQAGKAQQQALALQQEQKPALRADAPLPERVLAFARLHPFATATAVGAALMIGPRRIMRYSTWVLPLISRFKR